MIPTETVAELAELFDRFNNAFEPASAEAREAELVFHSQLEALRQAHAPDVEFSAFRYELVAHCRRYLAKNP